MINNKIFAIKINAVNFSFNLANKYNWIIPKIENSNSSHKNKDIFSFDFLIKLYNKLCFKIVLFFIWRIIKVDKYNKIKPNIITPINSAILTNKINENIIIAPIISMGILEFL